MPDYAGPVAGTWIHGIYTGGVQLQDPARDIPYIRALYDCEVELRGPPHRPVSSRR